MSKEINPLNFVKFPLKFDEYGGEYIFDVDNNMICQIRGFGRLQYVTDEKGNRTGEIDCQRACHIQDEIGKWIVETLNTAAQTGNSERETR